MLKMLSVVRVLMEARLGGRVISKDSVSAKRQQKNQLESQHVLM